MILDVTMTACMRPGIIERTLRSFKENLFKGHPFRLIINVDPVGENIRLPEVVEAVWSCLSDHTTVWRFPVEPSFPKAFQWVWSQVETDWVFHLEDDWELMREIDLDAMLDWLERHQDFAILRLPAFLAGEKDMKNWNIFFPWNGEVFECPQDRRQRVGFCGHPSLIRGKWLRKVLSYMNDERNPEKQIQFPERNPLLFKEMLSWRYGVWAKPGDLPAVRDIGREWIGNTNWRKQGSRSFFVRWEKV